MNHAHDSATHDPQTRTAVVCGGGVAGLTAAVDLAQHGWRVTLIEQRARLGGRASSVDDPKTNETIDNCQHVVMRACTALLDLYDRLGVADQIEWSQTLRFADPDEPTTLHALAGDDLPAPVHLLRPLLKFGLLSMKQRFTVARGMVSVLQAGSTHRARTHYNDTSFADWLNEHGQDADVVERFWSPIIVSACNETPDRVAAGYAFQVFQEGMMATDDAYHLGLALCPLAALYDPATPIIEAHGGNVRLGTTVSSVNVSGGRATGVTLNTGETLDADAVVVAVPFDRMGSLLPEGLAGQDERFADLDALEQSPIVGIHLYVTADDDGTVLPAPHVALPTRPVHWFFGKGSVELPEQAPGTKAEHVHGVISAAHDVIDQSADDLAALGFDELKRLHGDRAGALRLVHHRVIKEKHATFSIRPGVDAARPQVSGPMQNLFVAGDWTDTGWPATMEGAARSGFAAAAAARGASASPNAKPGTLLYRLLAG